MSYEIKDNFSLSSLVMIQHYANDALRTLLIFDPTRYHKKNDVYVGYFEYNKFNKHKRL